MMTRAWKKLDLQGAGLQALNLHLARHLKRRRTAYLLWLAFPLGAHRIYLEERVGGLVYPGLAALALILWLAGTGAAPLIPLAVMVALALYDLYWIDGRVTRLNKQLRMQAYLGQAPAPPPGYRGRYADTDSLEDYLQEKDRERPGVGTARTSHSHEDARRARRVPSFAEQEKLLRELARDPSKHDASHRNDAGAEPPGETGGRKRNKH